MSTKACAAETGSLAVQGPPPQGAVNAATQVHVPALPVGAVDLRFRTHWSPGPLVCDRDMKQTPPQSRHNVLRPSKLPSLNKVILSVELACYQPPSLSTPPSPAPGLFHSHMRPLGEMPFGTHFTREVKPLAQSHTAVSS